MPNTGNELQMKKLVSPKFAHNCCMQLWKTVDRIGGDSPRLHAPGLRTCGVARMELDSDAPCFEKTMTHTMLQKNFRVLIPASFIRFHSHMLGAVISLTGSSGETWTVGIKRYSRDGGLKEFHFYLGYGWKEFVKEAGLQVGDCVVFRMVGNSCFHVLVSRKLQEDAVAKTTPLAKCEKERGLGKSGREDDGVVSQPKVPRLHRKVKSRDQATTVPQCESKFCNPRETRGIPRDNVKEAAVTYHPRLSKANFVKHPGLEAAISSNSGFPQFISKLSRMSVGGRDMRLEIPFQFAKEHGHKIQERVRLLGPNGQRRVVTIKVYSSFRTITRVQIRPGWKAFALENGFKKGDVLLLSLVGFSKFLVQVFPVATRNKLFV